MRRAALVLLALAGCSGPRQNGPTAAPEQSRPKASPSCEEAKDVAFGAWTVQRDRLAREAIRAFDEAAPTSVALAEAYVGHLEALVGDLGRRDAALESSLAALREELAALRGQVAAVDGEATTAAVLAGEGRHLAVLEAARRLTQRVIRRRTPRGRSPSWRRASAGRTSLRRGPASKSFARSPR